MKRRAFALAGLCLLSCNRTHGSPCPAKLDDPEAYLEFLQREDAEPIIAASDGGIGVRFFYFEDGGVHERVFQDAKVSPFSPLHNYIITIARSRSQDGGQCAREIIFTSANWNASPPFSWLVEPSGDGGFQRVARPWAN